MTEMIKFEGMIYGEPEKRVGDQVGNYRLIRWLGRGAFADVYLGEHVYLKTLNAIKMLHVHLSKKALKDFLKEARVIASLDHPHIVRVLDCGDENGTPFLVMTYAPKGSLRQRFPEGMRLSLEQIVPLVQQMASALDYAHQHMLIYRDVKPENMLLGPQNQVLLSDFGVVLVAQDMLSQAANAMVGTALYMAPEMVQGKVHFASDQYALGVVTYEWLCGEYPFTGSYIQVGTQHMLVPPPSLCEKVPGLPPAVERVVFKAFAKNRAQRYESVTAFANALRDACKDTLSTTTDILMPQSSSQSLKTLPLSELQDALNNASSATANKSMPQPSSPSIKRLPVSELQDVSKDASSVTVNKPMPQLSSPSIKRLPVSAERSILPEDIKPTQSPGGIWRTMLLVMAVVAVIAAGMRLWYNITSSHASRHSTVSVSSKYNATSTVIGSSGVMVSVTANGTVSRGTSGSVPSTSTPRSYEAESSREYTDRSGGSSWLFWLFRRKAVVPVGSSGYSLQFNNVWENKTGSYTLSVYYINGTKSNVIMKLNVNGVDQQSYSIPSTGNWDTVNVGITTVNLNAGNNTITLSGAGVPGVPGFDRIVV